MTQAKEALRILRDDERSESDRIAAAKTLAAVGTIDSIGLMFEMLERAESNLGLAIAESLRTLNAGALLARELKTGETKRRVKAAMGLVRLLDPRTLDALLEATRDADAAVRVQVFQALLRFGGERVKDALLRALEDESGDVRCFAALGLGKLGTAADADALEKAAEVESDPLARQYMTQAARRLQPNSEPTN